MLVAALYGGTSCSAYDKGCRDKEGGGQAALQQKRADETAPDSKCYDEYE